MSSRDERVTEALNLLSESNLHSAAEEDVLTLTELGLVNTYFLYPENDDSEEEQDSEQSDSDHDSIDLDRPSDPTSVEIPLADDDENISDNDF